MDVGVGRGQDDPNRDQGRWEERKEIHNEGELLKGRFRPKGGGFGRRTSPSRTWSLPVIPPRDPGRHRYSSPRHLKRDPDTGTTPTNKKTLPPSPRGDERSPLNRELTNHWNRPERSGVKGVDTLHRDLRIKTLRARLT